MSSSYTKHTDEELFSLITQGNEQAFVELYTRYRGRIYAYALRMLGDRDRASDVFQETFTRIYQQSKNSERELSNVSAYVFTTARNICLNAIRDQKPSTSVEDYHQVIFQPSHENIELAKLVKTALELLPQHHREAFVLREYDGLSYQEIADLTGHTLATVKIHIFRAKEKLRKILAPYLEEAA
jgi:RNA polymerase sigma-70 factor (ECF subfamily)